MNFHHLVSSVSRRLLSMGCLMLAACLQQLVHAVAFEKPGADLSKFRRIEPQYIAALGDPGATSGNGAQAWGLWSQDPGPRGCKLDRYDQLKAAGGVAPSQWKFDAADWRLGYTPCWRASSTAACHSDSGSFVRPGWVLRNCSNGRCSCAIGSGMGVFSRFMISRTSATE